MEKRLVFAEEKYPGKISFQEGDILDYDFLSELLKIKKPDAIVHLGEMPSAPYSMIDVHHAVYTQQNNVLGTMNLLFAMRDQCPNTHLIKLGCYSEDTQVLTRSGWKYFYELKYDDEVCTLDPTTEEIRYDNPSNIVAYRYRGKMFKAETQNTDFLITPNHRVVYRYVGAQYANRAGPIHIETAETVFGKSFAIPKSGLWNQPDVESFHFRP